MVNDGTFKVFLNKLKLVFKGGTIVSKMPIPAIPSHQFKFKAIDDFISGKFTTDLLYGDLCFLFIVSYVFNFTSTLILLCNCFSFTYSLDIVGVLQDVVKTQMGGGGKKSCANITLRDKAGNVIEVALWEDSLDNS